MGEMGGHGFSPPSPHAAGAAAVVPAARRARQSRMCPPSAPCWRRPARRPHWRSAAIAARSCPGAGPEQDEGHERDAEFEAGPGEVRLAIGIDDFQPGLGVRGLVFDDLIVAVIECSAHWPASEMLS